jgi:hypothetical protein
MHTLTSSKRVLTVVVAFACAAAAARCASKPTATEAAAGSTFTPVLSVKELMENIVDPQADYVFDAVGSDIGPKGIVDIKPTTDDDWTRIQRGAYVLAESSNLLKMPRKMAPEGDRSKGGPGQPELSADQIEAKVKENPALWNSHADTLRTEALKVIDIVKARDADKLLAAGSAIDAACETCHLDFWYPGDREAVLKDRASRAYIDKPSAPKK